MGLLDDAIREHLDLKRRRGADPADIERAEREALGPVRREPESAVAQPYPDEAELPEGPVGADEPWEEEPFDELEEEPPAPRFSDPGAAAHPGSALDEEEPFADELPRRPEREPAEATGQPPQRSRFAAGQEETAEFHVPAAGQEGGEDVLEETPEFLQDTPDHDRLWFEQRPPRDFDFDG